MVQWYADLLCCILVPWWAPSLPRTPTWRPQALQGPQLGGPGPPKDANLEAPDLKKLRFSLGKSLIFKFSCFPCENDLDLLFGTSWASFSRLWASFGWNFGLLGRLLGVSWRLLGSIFCVQGALGMAKAPWDTNSKAQSFLRAQF